MVYNYYNDVITAYAVETGRLSSPQEYISCLQSVAFLFKPILQRHLLERFTVILSYSVGPVYLEECKLCPFLIYFFSFLQSLLALLDLFLAGCRSQLFQLMGKDQRLCSSHVFLFINTGSIQAFQHTVTPWQLNSW